MHVRGILTAILLFGLLSTAIGQDVASSPERTGPYALPATDDGLPGVGPLRRYEWFQNLWHRKRSQWAQQVEQDQGALVFLGDSITQGWGDDLGGSFPGVKVANRGISGDTTRGMLIRLSEDVLALRPRGVVLLMGTNDLEEQATPEEVAHNFGLIIEALHEHNPEMPIVACQVFPSSETKKRPADKIRRVNQLLAASVRGNSQVVLLDTWTLFADESGDAKLAEFPDLLHPNEIGYAKWAGALRPLLATAGFLETEPPEFVVEEGFESLFNGEDLSGWCFLPTTEAMLAQRERWQSRDKNAPPWPVVKERVEFQGPGTPEGRYVAKHGRLVVTTPPEGRKIQQLWTTREFPHDFTLKLQFRATPNADSGVFLRGRQLQCRDYLLAGPYKELKNYRAGDWNELVVQVKGTVAHCTCNGELLEAAFEIPETGPIGLEGDRGQIEYRHLRISRP